MKKPPFIARTLFVALSLLAASSAQALSSINLDSYSVTGNYALDTLNDMGLEASAVTYAKDRGSLFFVGDEGLGVVEMSLTGQTEKAARPSTGPAPAAATTTRRA